MIAITTVVAAGAPLYMSKPNRIAGGSDPHVPGATGSQPNPKHVAIHRFQFIRPKHYPIRPGQVKGKQTRLGSRALCQKGSKTILQIGEFRTNLQKALIVRKGLAGQLFAPTTRAA